MPQDSESRARFNIFVTATRQWQIMLPRIFPLTAFLLVLSLSGCGSGSGGSSGGSGGTTNVYLAGHTSNAKGTPIVTYWKNGEATNLTDGTMFALADAIAIDSSGNIYVAGETTTPQYTAAYWKNGTATNLGNGTEDT